MENLVTLADINQAVKNGKIEEIAPRQTKPTLAIERKAMMEIIGFDALPTKQYVIERLEISPGNLVLLCATGCSGKTMLAQYIATCISGGAPLFGMFPVKNGGVIHIDMEQSEIQTLRRYIRLANGVEVKKIDVARVTLKNRLDSPMLPLEEVEKELVELCTGKVLCVVDSLKAVSCADENSDKIEVVLKMFKRVAEKTQCAVLCVHHKGKGKDAKQSGRGHSSIYDSADVQFDLDASNEVYEISCAKNREGKYFDGIKYQLLDEGSFHMGQNCTEKLVFNPLQMDIKSTKQTQREKIIEALRSADQLKFNDLFGHVRGDRAKFGEVLDTMIENNEVVMVPGPRNAKLYSLTEDFKSAEGWE